MKKQIGFCYELVKNQAFWSHNKSVAYNPCSFYDGYIDRNIPANQAWFGSNHKKIIEIINKNEPVPGCHRCYSEEQAGRVSRRQAAAALKRGSSTSCSEDDSSLDVSGGSGRAPRKTDRDLMLPFNDSEDGKTSPSTAESKEDGGLPPAARAPIVPTKRDVLLGRGWKLQNHDGNVIFRQFLEDYAEAYDRSPRLEKRKMVRTLVLSMKRDGTRFLKQSEENSDIWMDSTMLEAENKVSQVFRTIRKNRQPKSGTVGV